MTRTHVMYYFILFGPLCRSVQSDFDQDDAGGANTKQH